MTRALIGAHRHPPARSETGLARRHRREKREIEIGRRSDPLPGGGHGPSRCPSCSSGRAVCPPRSSGRAPAPRTPVRYLNVAPRPPPADYHWIYVPRGEVPVLSGGDLLQRACRRWRRRARLALRRALRSRGEPDGSGAATTLVRRPWPPASRRRERCSRRDDPASPTCTELELRLRGLRRPLLSGDRDTIRAWLGVARHPPRGRYGTWTYNSMEDCLLAGARRRSRSTPSSRGEGELVTLDLGKNMFSEPYAGEPWTAPVPRIVIPVYNEERIPPPRWPSCASGWREACGRYEILSPRTARATRRGAGGAPRRRTPTLKVHSLASPTTARP
jgi:hypothetical protein